MKTLSKIVKSVMLIKADLKTTYGIKRVGIFGPYRHGRATNKSDLDILVEFSKAPTIFQFVEIERHLSRDLGVKVDLVTPKALKPLMKKEVLREVIFV